MNKVLVQQRLDYFDQMLLACGWVRQESNWLAPAHMRELLALEVGAGSVKRSLAVAAQVQFDEACENAFAQQSLKAA